MAARARGSDDGIARHERWRINGYLKRKVVDGPGCKKRVSTKVVRASCRVMSVRRTLSIMPVWYGKDRVGI